MLFKRFLFAGIVCVLLLPMIGTFVKLVEIPPLNGVYPEVVSPQWSSKSWMGGTYQDSMQTYLNHNVGFRGLFVRTNNQLKFSLHGMYEGSGVIVGRDNYLFEYNYISAHQGNDFIGADKIRAKVAKLEAVTDSLNARGIHVVVLFAPGKGSFYPEFIPDEFRSKSGPTNYETYCSEMRGRKINLLDFHRWFDEMKATSPHPLFPKTGIHWSKYGEYLATDSLLKHLNTLGGDFECPKLVLNGIRTSRKMVDTDDDIEKSMNLLFDIPDLEMGYPSFAVQNTSQRRMPKVLTVADSYFWGMYNWGISKKCFDNGEFWYYNRQVYPVTTPEQQYVDGWYNVERIEQNDVILILVTDANLPEFAFGIIDRLYYDYCEVGYHAREKRIQQFSDKIRQNPEWLKSIQQKAEAKGITLEEALRIDASYLEFEAREADGFRK